MTAGAASAAAGRAIDEAAGDDNAEGKGDGIVGAGVPPGAGGAGVALGLAEHPVDQRGRAQGQQEVGLRLGGGPDGVEPRVVELDQPLPRLHQPDQVGLPQFEEPLQPGDLLGQLLGSARTSR